MKTVVSASAMLAAFVAGSIANQASAQVLVPHSEVCKGAIVSKELLATHLISLHPVSMKYLVGQGITPSRQQYGPERWRTIIADPNFCPAGGACSSEDQNAVQDMRLAFADFLITGAHGGGYTADNVDMPATEYFVGDDRTKAIRCVGSSIETPKPKPKPDTSALRVRGDSDDLYISRSQKTDFKGASKATLSLTGDHSDQKTFKVSSVGSIGYAFNLPSSAWSLQAVPYISWSQSQTQTEGKPVKLDDSNYVAVGVLTRAVVRGDDINHYFMAKPQFLHNTKDESEIASMRLIYQPWTFYRTPINFNTATYIPANESILKFLFDLRLDSGIYTDKGNAADASKNKSFERAGSKFGFSWTLPDPSFVLTVTETMLYGVEGSIRKLTLFESSISYDFDPNGYFGVKLSYKKGRDEETADRVQIWTLAFTAKY